MQALHNLLNEDWLFDRIYLKHLEDGSGWHICLNPRYVDQYMRFGTP